MLNEHDLSDMCPLYDLQTGDKFRLAPEEDTGDPVKVPPAHQAVDFSDIFTFFHVDGMYSFCKNSKNEVVHFAAWTEVTKL